MNLVNGVSCHGIFLKKIDNITFYDKCIMITIIIHMCGIWALLSQTKINNFGKLYEAFMKIQPRGPDNSSFQLLNPFTLLGFHRLAIMDLTAEGNQPFHHVRQDGSCVYAVCNGEIYPHLELKKAYAIETKSHSDCEVIIPLYERVGVKKMCELLGSEFAFIIFDISKDGKVKMVAGRDPIGVRPMFYGVDDSSICLASEMKGMSDVYDKCYVFPPGHFMVYDDGKMHMEAYYKYEYKELDPVPPIDEIYKEVRKRLTNAVRRRLMTDREMGFLVSGGLDSSLVAGIAIDLIEKEMPHLKDKEISMFTIGFKSGSTDVPYAIEVVDFLKKKHPNIKHHIITIDENEALDAIDETIYACGSLDITSTRASTMNRLVCKYISENTSVKCILSGELSDELLNGYLYSFFAPSARACREDAIRLVKDVHRFDGLRACRSAGHHGLELRLPFAEKEFVDYIFSLPPELTTPSDKQIEKALLRNSFAGQNILPDSVLFRKKAAMSDAVSKKERSWYQIIQEHIEKIVTDKEYNENKDKYSHCKPFTKESYYYRKKFVEYYGDSEEKAKTIPYFWMPKWVISNDPSARTLSICNE